MIILDGSMGEGGGQIVRTALALSLITGKSFRIENIRKNRKPPCLRPQHLAAVEAAARISGGSAEGAYVGSREFTFFPGKTAPGKYQFDIGTAGSTTLLLQAVLPPLMLASHPSSLILKGGTHNTFAPPFDFLERTFLPVLDRFGPRVDLRLEKHGFYPKGGGRLTALITPAVLKPVEILERGKPVRRMATAVIAGLPRHIAERELEVVISQLGFKETETMIEELPSYLGPVNFLMIETEFKFIGELFTAFGRKGVTAEAVAEEAVREAIAYLSSDAPVGAHLADQLVIPLALAGGGAYRTSTLTAHTVTNLEVVRKFLDVNISCVETPENDWLIKCS